MYSTVHARARGLAPPGNLKVKKQSLFGTSTLAGLLIK